jgi:hypothetical protein
MPFVSDKSLWMVQHQGLFQGCNFFHHTGLARNLRDPFKGQDAYGRTAEFVALYGNPAFDPANECLPLNHFEPMVRRLRASPRNSVCMAAMIGQSAAA